MGSLCRHLKNRCCEIHVNASPDAIYHATIKKYGFGKTNREAADRAEKIQFSATSKDSVLDIGNGYAIDKDSKFRGQNVEVEILVPAGKKIRFDESVKRKLNSIHVKVKRSERRNRVKGLEITAMMTPFITGQGLIMRWESMGS